MARIEIAASAANGWTESAIVEQALEHNPLLRAAQMTVDQAEGRLLQAGRWENPELRLSYTGDQAFGDNGEASVSIGLSQRFPVTKRLKLEKAIARDEIKLARLEIANEANRLRQDVSLAVVALAHTEAELRLREGQAQLNREFLGFIESRIEAGEASRVEADQLRIALYAIEQEVGQLRNEKLMQTGVILGFMGVEPAYPFRLNYGFELPSSAPMLPDFSDDLLHKHPAYLVRQLVLELSEKNLARARTQRWADVTVELFFEEDRSIDDPIGLERDRVFGLGVSLPLPLLDRKEGTLVERRAYRIEMQWRMEAAEARLRNEASLQRERVNRLYAQASLYEAEVTRLVEQNLVDMQAAYARGQISLSDLFQTQEQRLKMQSTQLRLRRELAEALIHWSAATAVVETSEMDQTEFSTP